MLALTFGAGAGWAAQEKTYQVTAAVGNNMNHTPSFVGVEKGIFLKHGIDLKLKVLSTGQEMVKAVQAGEAQFVGSAYSNFPIAVEGFKAKGVVGLWVIAPANTGTRPWPSSRERPASLGLRTSQERKWGHRWGHSQVPRHRPRGRHCSR
jgi:ABC-type nitrate/sulfonate/bicarbonate transport system substrate-binding protein